MRTRSQIGKSMPQAREPGLGALAGWPDQIHVVFRFQMPSITDSHAVRPIRPCGSKSRQTFLTNSILSTYKFSCSNCGSQLQSVCIVMPSRPTGSPAGSCFSPTDRFVRGGSGAPTCVDRPSGVAPLLPRPCRRRTRRPACSRLAAATRRPGPRRSPRMFLFASACGGSSSPGLNAGVLGLATPGVLRSFTHRSSPEAPSLRRHYPASSVVRASPPPCPARPVPCGIPVGACHATGRASRVAAVSLLRACHRQYPGGTDRCSRRSLPGRWQPSPFCRRVGFRIALFEACSTFTARCSLHAR